MTSSEKLSAANRRVVTRLGIVIVAMFGFGYALVPLYDLFCEITGVGGRTGVITEAQARSAVVDESRRVKVQFTGNSTSKLPWDFRSTVKVMEVTPGKAYTVSYLVRNRSSEDVIGQAVPSVAPFGAGKYFNKTECFCFTSQLLKAGEEKEMPVRFIVDANLPDHVKTITLSYSFFNATDLVTDG